MEKRNFHGATEGRVRFPSRSKLLPDVCPEAWAPGPDSKLKELSPLQGPLSAEPDPGPSLADAPWSSKCRALFPVLEELGVKYQNHSTVTVAKIDITANDIQLMHLDRYPFFRLFPTNSEQVRGSWHSPNRLRCDHEHHFSLVQLCPLPSQLPSQLRPRLPSPIPLKAFAISFHRSPRTHDYWVRLKPATHP